MRTAIAILTLNEADRLAACVERFPRCYPVFVIDSGSTDATVDIAKNLGAQVLRNAWPGFAGQRNFAIDSLSEFEWILFVDADELYPKEFFSWMEAADHANVDIYQVSSRIVVDEKVLQHAPAYPIYHPRLVRAQTTRFVANQSGHGETVEPGLRIGHIDIPYEHRVLDIGMNAWLSKHVRLAQMEIEAEAGPSSDEGHLTWRRRLSSAVGGSFVRVPLRFVFHYFVAGGIFDGRPGFRYSVMYTWFEMAKWLLRRSKR